MSHESTLITEGHFAYLAARTTGDDPLLTELKAAAAEAGIPRIWISPEQGSLLQILIRLHKARSIVEVGTLAGYSALWMARALPEDGHLLTIELDEGRAAFARRWFDESEIGSRIELRCGDGREVLPTIPDESVDVLFLDADKAGYAEYLVEGLRFVRTGGMILVDNAFAFGELLNEAPSDPETQAVKEFNELIAREPRLTACICPIGDGMWVAIKES